MVNEPSVFEPLKLYCIRLFSFCFEEMTHFDKGSKTDNGIMPELFSLTACLFILSIIMYEHSCPKLTTLLVNETSNFQIYYMQKHCHFFS